MARSDRAIAFALLSSLGALAAPACVATVSEEGRACPCSAGFACCAASSTCVPSGSECRNAEASRPERDASEPPAEAAPDPSAEASTEAGLRDAGCGAIPAPVVHFPFDDCDARGVYRDRAGGLVGVRHGDGVRCSNAPNGPALAFDGNVDAGDAGGSYVRVLDSDDAGVRACTHACRPVPEQFTDALTISVVLRVDGAQAFAHILGQWYGDDSFMLLTEADPGGEQRMELSAQPADSGNGPITIAAPFPVDTWIHWVAVYDRGAVRLYRDGARVAEGQGPAGPLRCTDVPLELGQIGRQSPCGGDIDYAYFRGAMSDLRLFDRALGAAEIASLECERTRNP